MKPVWADAMDEALKNAVPSELVNGELVPIPEDRLHEHPVLARLLREVANEKDVPVRYDRVHNRHNRS